MLNYLSFAVQAKASDIFFLAGSPVMIRKAGALAEVSEEKLRPEDTKRMVSELYRLAVQDAGRAKNGQDTFSFPVPQLGRFRVSIFRQRGSMAAVVRVIAFRSLDPVELGIPQGVLDLTALRSGLVLTAGPSGSGRSVTQACMVQHINRTREAHVLTFEDPIEFLHANDRSMVSQCEVGSDVPDYLTGLQECLKQSPDVVVVDRISDWETVREALRVADSGRLVIAGVTANSELAVFRYLLGVFPDSLSAQAKVQLSHCIRGLVFQKRVMFKSDGVRTLFSYVGNSDLCTLCDARLNGPDGNKALKTCFYGRNTTGPMDELLMSLYKDRQITEDSLFAACCDPMQVQAYFCGVTEELT